MTKFEKEVIERLIRIETDFKNARNDLKEDHKILHGNGQPGLIHRVTVLENHWHWIKWLAGLVGTGVGVVLSLAKKFFFN